MVPKVNNRGHSFKGVMAYLAHDKDASTSERLAWSETGNMHTDDLEKAAKVMAWTDHNADLLKRDFGGSSAGRKSEAGAAYHYSLSWAIGEEPDQEHMRKQAHATLEKLGLTEHQFVIVAHNDTDHSHVHVVANLTNPETGKRHTPSFDKRELQAWALTYEREHGLHCRMREINAAMREQEGAGNYYIDKKTQYSIKLTRAYEASDDGKSFINALELEGFTLAKGRKSFVAVDQDGDILNLSKLIDGHKTKDIKAKLGDLGRENLPDADALKKDIQERKAREAEYEKAGNFDRDKYEREQQEKIEEAAIKKAIEEDKQRKADEAHDNARQFKEQQREREQADRVREEKYARIQKRIDEKIAASRKTWEINELSQAKEQARVELEQKNTLFNRIFRHGEILEAADHYQDISKRLEERQQRFRDDIEAFNRNRPAWLKNRDLKKHGIEQEDSQGRSESEGGKRPDPAAIREAQSSPEAAERMAENVQAKTQRQKAKVSQIKEKAKESRAKREAKKAQTTQEQKAKEAEKTREKEKTRQDNTKAEKQREQQRGEEATKTAQSAQDAASQDLRQEFENQAREFSWTRKTWSPAQDEQERGNAPLLKDWNLSEEHAQKEEKLRGWFSREISAEDLDNDLDHDGPEIER